MAAKKTDLDAEIERLYRGPLDAFTSARNDLAKQRRKAGGKDDAERVRVLPKPTPSAWAVNVLFDRESEKMDALLAAGERARAGQRQAVAGRGVEALRASLGEVRGLIDELRRRGAAVLAESGRAVSRDVIERIGTDLQALALSPDAAEEASRHWLDHDLDPPGFEVLAGLQLAGAPVVAREEKKAPERAEIPVRRLHAVPQPKKTARDSAREDEERKRQESAERARREREEERLRRRIEVAEEKAERSRDEADSRREEAEMAEKAASEARRRAEAAELTASRAREKADRAAERLARAEDEVKEAKGGG
jgi:hypothetical protein